MIARVFFIPLIFVASHAFAMQLKTNPAQSTPLDHVPEWIEAHIQSLKLDAEATLLVKYELNKHVIALGLGQQADPNKENAAPLPERFRMYNASSLIILHKEIARKIRELRDIDTHNDTVNQLIQKAHELAHKEIESLQESAQSTASCQHSSGNQPCTECKLSKLMQEYRECELPLDQRYILDVCAIL